MNDILRIDRSLPSSNEIEKRFRIFSSMLVFSQSKVTSTSTFETTHFFVENGESHQTTSPLTIHIVQSNLSSHLNFAAVSVKMKNDFVVSKMTSMNQTLIETNVFEKNIIFSFTSFSMFFLNSFIQDENSPMFFSTKSAPKNRNEISNQSLSISNIFNSFTTSRNFLSFINERIHCVYSGTLSTISIDSFIVLKFLFKNSQSFLTAMSRFQKISKSTISPQNFQSTSTVFYQTSTFIITQNFQSTFFQQTRAMSVSISSKSIFTQSISSQSLIRANFHSLSSKRFSIRSQLSERIIDVDE